MSAPVVRPFVAADAVALGAAPGLVGVGWAGLAACSAWTIEWDGRPVWAGGVVPTAPGVGEVWAVVAPAMTPVAPTRLARELRRGLLTVARTLGLTTLTAHIPPGTPARHQAFQAWLGFRPGGACAFDAHAGTHTARRVG